MMTIYPSALSWISPSFFLDSAHFRSGLHPPSPLAWPRPQREQRDLKKLRQVMDPAELALTHPQLSHDDHLTQLHQAYKELEAEYMKVIEKLAAAPEIM